MIKTLSRGNNHALILKKAHEEKLITERERDNLTITNKADVEEHVVKFVDKIMMKGEDTCQAFIGLLEADEAIQTSLEAVSLKDVCPSPPSVHCDVQPPERKRIKEDECYQLKSQPTGLCVIINNEKFMDGSLRSGTDKDAESLAEVFTWLGFRVLMCRDQTMDQMERSLKCFASLTPFSELQLKLEFKAEEWLDSKFTELDHSLHHGDAFICCILSHGEAGTVLGIDRKPLPIKKLTAMFKTTEESALEQKPKVFLIQACQGAAIQRGVVVNELEADDSGSHSIPEQADILIALATVEDYKAMRHIRNGSWFIQSLCEQLKDCCPRGEDITKILHNVNRDVSRKEAKQQPGAAKQMSEFTSRLTKTLVLLPRVT